MPCPQPGHQRRVLTRRVADGFQRDGGSAQGSVCRRSGILGQELPRETETSGGGDSRKRDRLNQGVIPSGGGVVRNMRAPPDGNLVMAWSGRNRVVVQLHST